MKSSYRLWSVCAALLAMLWVAPVFAEPSMHQVYEAAEAGQLGQAQQMMSEVLKAHPNSGKAHYVEAELLAKQRDFSLARQELATAERLSPGLNFASQRSVTELKEELSATGSRYVGGHGVTGDMSRGQSFPGGMLIFGVVLVLGIIMIVALLVRRRASAVYGGMPGGSMYGGSQPVSPYPGYPPQGGLGGTGGGLLGSLATGAAMGAGVVAGEALMDRILDGGERRREPFADQGIPGGGMSDDYINNDMGGSDFGIADSSWGSDQDFGMDSSNDWS